jgi:putative ABC transport system permease protein
LGISLSWGLLFSLAPATELFKKTVGRVRARARAMLVVTQIGSSLVLLIGAGLLARTFVEIQRVDPGFDASGRVTLRIALPEGRYPNPRAVVAAQRHLKSALAAIPGVTRVGAISHLPYDELPNWYLTYGLEASSNDNGVAKADARVISTGLLETLAVPLLDGRDFAEDETRGVLPVIVDEMLARHLWPGRRAVGQRFAAGQASPEFEVTVIGVVRHLRIRSLVEDLTPQIFLPSSAWQRSPMAYVLHTDRDVASIAADVRAAVAAFDPRLPVFDVRPLDDYLESARSIRRFTMVLAATFAAAALLLTCIGIYGVLAYAVAHRRHEIGVRRALGATAGRVIWDVMREGLACAAVGSAAGLAISAAGSSWLRNQLYAVDPRDPVTYVTAVALVAAAAAIAGLVPAYRASSISPMDAIRER